MTEKDERLTDPDSDNLVPDQDPEGGPPSGEPGGDHEVEEVTEWR